MRGPDHVAVARFVRRAGKAGRRERRFSAENRSLPTPTPTPTPVPAPQIGDALRHRHVDGRQSNPRDTDPDEGGQGRHGQRRGWRRHGRAPLPATGRPCRTLSSTPITGSSQGYHVVMQVSSGTMRSPVVFMNGYETLEPIDVSGARSTCHQRRPHPRLCRLRPMASTAYTCDATHAHRERPERHGVHVLADFVTTP